MRHSIAWPRSTTSLLRDRQRLAGGGADPSLTMSMPVVILGHAVLDLHARVHLEEEVLAVLQQALDRAGADVVDGGGGVDGDLADVRAQLLVDRGAGRLLDQLLVAALDRAVALAEVDHVAVPVGEHLHLDVARVGQVALEVDRRVGEELLALARGALEGLLAARRGQRDAEALAAAAARGLDRDRVADRPRRSSARGLERRRPARSCRGRSARRPSCISSRARGLRAHRLDRAGGRADEGDARVLAGASRRRRSRPGSRSRGGWPRRRTPRSTSRIFSIMR